MNIKSVNSIVQIQNFSNISREESNIKSPFLGEKDNSVLPAYAYKANFLPSFGKFKTVQNLTILNRDTGRTVNASLQKETIGEFLMFKLLVNKEEVGFMNLSRDAIFEEGDFILPEPNNNIPKVTHIRTLKGDKYAGIGSALLSVAVEESKKCGRNGALWLFADSGYARTYSAYRKNENPIPFYYKLGFVSLDTDIHNKITNALASGDYDKLPNSALLVLPSANAEHLQSYYDSHYTMNLE